MMNKLKTINNTFLSTGIESTIISFQFHSVISDIIFRNFYFINENCPLRTFEQLELEAFVVVGAQGHDCKRVGSEFSSHLVEWNIYHFHSCSDNEIKCGVEFHHSTCNSKCLNGKRSNLTLGSFIPFAYPEAKRNFCKWQLLYF